MAEPVVAVEEAVPVVRNQIKVTAVGRVYKYVTYARDLLNKGANEVVIRAMGGAISNAIIVASLLRRGVLGLAQITDVTSKGVESNVKRPEQTVVPQIVIRLSANFSDEDKTHYGYQEALPEDQHVPFEDRPRAHPSAENVGGPEEGGQAIPHHQQHPHYFHHQQQQHHHHQHQPHHQQHPGQQQHHHHQQPHHQQPHHQQQQGYHMHPAPHHLQQPHHQHPGQHFHQHQGDQAQGPRRHSYGRYNGNHHNNNVGGAGGVPGGAPIVNNNNGNVGAGVPNDGLNGGVGIAPNNGAGNYYGGRGGYRGSRGRSGPTSGYRGRGGFRPNYNRGYGQDGRQPRAPYDPNAPLANNGEILDGRAPRRHFYQPKYEVPLAAAPSAAASSSSSSSSAAPVAAPAAAPAPAAPEAAVAPQ